MPHNRLLGKHTYLASLTFLLLYFPSLLQLMWCSFAVNLLVVTKGGAKVFYTKKSHKPHYAKSPGQTPGPGRTNGQTDTHTRQNLYILATYAGWAVKTIEGILTTYILNLQGAARGARARDRRTTAPATPLERPMSKLDRVYRSTDRRRRTW